MEQEQLTYALLLQQLCQDPSAAAHNTNNGSLAALQSQLLANVPTTAPAPLQNTMSTVELLNLFQTQSKPSHSAERTHTPTTDLRSASSGGGRVVSHVMEDKTYQQKIRAQKNREAAARSRQRAKQLTEDLQQQVKELVEENERLRSQLQQRDSKIQQLTAVVDALKACKGIPPVGQPPDAEAP